MMIQWLELLLQCKIFGLAGPVACSLHDCIHDSSFLQGKDIHIRLDGDSKLLLRISVSSVAIGPGSSLALVYDHWHSVGLSTLPSPPRPPQQDPLLTHRHAPPSYSFQQPPIIWSTPLLSSSLLTMHRISDDQAPYMHPCYCCSQPLGGACISSAPVKVFPSVGKRCSPCLWHYWMSAPLLVWDISLGVIGAW